ncbi:DUF565 domain-containing protein [Prochlorococcus sp. MIT 1300]|uniref:DUF565 domain-containing protein n=1 Tax=Prochlorococcus sp. MIT 1300 TaxID=3096218 RepID=UPI002A75CAB4|nr:DUF565 domain-containing protein [Prochlorococcus sp. MIT 1300]
MSLQKTRFDKFQKYTGGYFSQSFFGSWRKRSLGLISLLVGFLVASELGIGKEILGRPLISLVMVVSVEVLVRLRTRVRTQPWPMSWLALDNFRIGAVYAVVLEAFKLGS